MKDNAKVRFHIDKTGFFAESAVLLLLQAIIFRVIGCWGLWHDRVNFIMLLLLPVCCCLLMILCILLFGKKGFFLSFIPVLLGVVFFVYRALDYSNWVHTVLCIMLYLVVAVVYTGTVFGWIPTKWLLPPLFGLPFLYLIIMEDIPALNNVDEPVSFLAGMREISVLCIMAALFCVGMGLKRRTAEPAAPAEAPQPVPAPAPAPQPAPAPAPAPAAAAEPRPAPAPSESASAEPEEGFSFSGEPYTPMLTLEPEPWEPEQPEEDKADESADE